MPDIQSIIAAPFAMKIDQIAFASYSEEETEAIKVVLGLSGADWVEDHCVAVGEVYGEPGANRARLLFCYAYGIEVEILQYLEGENYLSAQGIEGGSVCHIGMHWDGTGDEPNFPGEVAQSVRTQTHTNPYLLEKQRKYKYTIYDTRALFGVNFKVIERIEGQA